MLSSVIFTKQKRQHRRRNDKTARDKAEQLAGLELLLNKEEVMKLQGVCLGDQLKLFKLAGAPNLVNCTLPTITDEALSEAVEWLTKIAAMIVTLEMMKRSSQTWIVMVIGQMRTETTICTIFSGFLHFTEQININLNLKCIAIQYIMYIVQKKRRETMENS